MLLLFISSEKLKYEKMSFFIRHDLIKMHILCNSYVLHIGSNVPITPWVDKKIKFLLQRVCCQSKKHATTAKTTISKMPQNASK